MGKLTNTINVDKMNRKSKIIMGMDPKPHRYEDSKYLDLRSEIMFLRIALVVLIGVGFISGMLFYAQLKASDEHLFMTYNATKTMITTCNLTGVN